MVNEKEDFELDDKTKRLTRREILCSTKRNQSIEPRILKTTDNKRKNNKNQDKSFRLLDIYRHDKIECRPWSPKKDEDF
jgi:hypothetical protein